MEAVRTYYIVYATLNIMKRLAFIFGLMFICSVIHAGNNSLQFAQLPEPLGEAETHKPPVKEIAALSCSTTSERTSAEFVKTVRTLVTEWKEMDYTDLTLRIRNCHPRNSDELDKLLNLTEGEKRDDVQKVILGAVEGLKDPALAPTFYKHFKKGNLKVKIAAIQMFAAFKYRDAVPDLIKLVDAYDFDKGDKGKNAEIALYSYLALGEIGDARAAPVVLKGIGKMNGNEDEVIAKFCNYLVPELLSIIRKSKNQDEVHIANNAVGKINDKNAVHEMWQIARDKNDKARSAALGMLSRNTDKTTTPTLNEYLTELWHIAKDVKDKSRYQALELLINKTDATTTPSSIEVGNYLEQNADQDSYFQKKIFRIAMARANIDYLIKAIQNPNYDLDSRIDAIDFLGELKAQSTIPVLEEALHMGNEIGRARAAEALKKITGKEYDWEGKRYKQAFIINIASNAAEEAFVTIEVNNKPIQATNGVVWSDRQVLLNPGQQAAHGTELKVIWDGGSQKPPVTATVKVSEPSETARVYQIESVNWPASPKAE